jgi:A/G-specific adenine glycosylase
VGRPRRLSTGGGPPGAAQAIAPVVAWFRADGRDLPWRRTRDPWAVLVSELMLQQTGVARVEPRYLAFLARFPTAAACAAAPVGDVVSLWQGLGYNRRAVNLHRAATAVVAEHGGEVPTDLDALLALPGIGPYTARAVLAFAAEEPVGVMDVNVARTLARLAGRPVTQAEADVLALEAAGGDEAAGGGAAGGSAWTWNQAVMELGARVCRPTPSCAGCPANDACSWRGGADGDAAAAGAPDPWVRPRAQSRFEGSDRQGRGRLVDALRAGPVSSADLASVMGWPDDPDRAVRVAATLLADGLAARTADGRWSLP